MCSWGSHGADWDKSVCKQSLFKATSGASAHKLQPPSPTLTASTGKEPAAVSPESMTQSVPSSTALATSDGVAMAAAAAVA